MSICQELLRLYPRFVENIEPRSSVLKRRTAESKEIEWFLREGRESDFEGWHCPHVLTYLRSRLGLPEDSELEVARLAILAVFEASMREGPRIRGEEGQTVAPLIAAKHLLALGEYDVDHPDVAREPDSGLTLAELRTERRRGDPDKNSAAGRRVTTTKVISESDPRKRRAGGLRQRIAVEASGIGHDRTNLNAGRNWTKAVAIIVWESLKIVLDEPKVLELLHARDETTRAAERAYEARYPSEPGAAPRAANFDALTRRTPAPEGLCDAELTYALFSKDDRRYTEDESYLEKGRLVRPSIIRHVVDCLMDMPSRSGGIVAIRGQTGMGKRTLARDAIEVVGLQEKAYEINMSTGAEFVRGLRSTLQADGVDIGSLVSRDQLVAAFAARSSNWERVRVLVLLDPESSADVGELFPASPNIPVLITSTSNITFSEAPKKLGIPFLREIAVPLLAWEEVSILLREAAPNDWPVYEVSFHSRIPHHLLTVLQCAAFVRAGGQNALRSLLDELTRVPDATIRRLSAAYGVPNLLVELCRNQVRQAQAIDLGEELLDVALWCFGFQKWIPFHIVREFIEVAFSSSVSELRLHAAVAELERMGIVETTAPSLGEIAIGPADLPFSIFFELTADRGSSVVRAWEAFALNRSIEFLHNPEANRQDLRLKYEHLFFAPVNGHTGLGYEKLQRLVTGRLSGRIVIIGLLLAPWIAVIVYDKRLKRQRAQGHTFFAQMHGDGSLYVRAPYSGIWHRSSSGAAAQLVIEGLTLSNAIWSLFIDLDETTQIADLESQIQDIDALSTAPLPRDGLPIVANRPDKFLL